MRGASPGPIATRTPSPVPKGIPAYITSGEAAMQLGILQSRLISVCARSAPPHAVRGGRYLFFDPKKINELRAWLVELGELPGGGRDGRGESDGPAPFGPPGPLPRPPARAVRPRRPRPSPTVPSRTESLRKTV